MPREPIEVGAHKQLFIDHLFLAESQGVQLVVNRPHPTGEQCIVADKPWEGHRVGGYTTVMDDSGVLKLWYDAIANDGSRWCCYATSPDGVYWEKPHLGIVPFGAERGTNIVFPPEPWPHEPGCVFQDANPNCPPDERYKMVCSLHPPTRENGTYVAASPDGLHWKLLGDHPAFRPSDTGNIGFFDPRIGRYVGYVRVNTPEGRKVGRCESDTITNWGREQVVLACDEEDRQALDPELFTNIDFYTSAALKYPQAQDVYFLFPQTYYHYRKEVALRLGATRHAGNDGPTDVQLATSRDGIHWNRLDRESFLRLGKAGAFDSGMVAAVTGCVCRADEVWLYYKTADFTHGHYDIARDRFKGVITRAVLRLDGFVSVEAGYRGGEFTTPPLRFSGQRLALNVDTSAGGHVRVELQDERGQPLAGLSAADCDPVNGNFIGKIVTWRGKADLSTQAGSPIRLRFLMARAKLYAFQVAGP